MTSDFLSVPDIMAVGQRISCIFLVKCYGLGFIDPSGESKDIEEGTKLELPMWMAKRLKSRHIIEIETPKSYDDKFREIVEADATIIDLHKHGPNYYTFGKHLISMDLKDSQAIARSMVDAFRQRFHKIFDYAVNSTPDTQKELLDFQAILDNQELELMKEGRKATVSFKEWETRKNNRLTTSDIVASLNKRKAAMIDDDH